MDLFWLTVSEVSVPHFREGKVDQSSSQPGSRKRKRERERENLLCPVSASRTFSK
jgi:hypothetical protein